MSGGWIEWAAAKAGYAAMSAVVNYTSEAVGGHIGYKTMDNTRAEVEQRVGNVLGTAGKAVGNIMGRAVAGHALPGAKKEADAVSGAVKTLGHLALDAISQKTPDVIENHEFETIAQAAEEQAQELAITAAAPQKQVTPGAPATQEKGNSNWLHTACYVAAQVSIVAGGVAVATGAVPAAPIGLVMAGTAAVPKIVNALTKRIDPVKDKVSLIDDVVVPVMTQTAISAAGVIVEGVTKCDTVNQAYNAVVNRGEQIGKGLTAYLPQSVQDFAGTVGKNLAKVEAGRHAMSDEVIEEANQRSLIVKNVTEMGLDTIDTAVRVGLSKTSDGGGSRFVKAAKTAGIIGAGIIGGAALMMTAPEVAAVTGGVALLGVADKAIKWTRQQMAPKD